MPAIKTSKEKYPLINLQLVSSKVKILIRANEDYFTMVQVWIDVE